MTTVRPDHQPAAQSIRDTCLSYPGSLEDHPWGYTVFKVHKKVFVFMGVDDTGHFGIHQAAAHGRHGSLIALRSSAGYGLRKAGWVPARFARVAKVFSAGSTDGVASKAGVKFKVKPRKAKALAKEIKAKKVKASK